jgi:hypothetical protein
MSCGKRRIIGGNGSGALTGFGNLNAVKDKLAVVCKPSTKLKNYLGDMVIDHGAEWQ